MAKLQLLSAEGQTLQEFVLTSVETTIGRSSDNQIVVRDGQMSRHHARVVRSGQATTIVDLGTPNGIWIRDNKVVNHPLEDGDVFKLGTSSFRFVAEDPDVEATIRAEAPSAGNAVTQPAGPPLGRREPVPEPMPRRDLPVPAPVASPTGPPKKEIPPSRQWEGVTSPLPTASPAPLPPAPPAPPPPNPGPPPFGPPSSHPRGAAPKGPAAKKPSAPQPSHTRLLAAGLSFLAVLLIGGGIFYFVHSGMSLTGGEPRTPPPPPPGSEEPVTPAPTPRPTLGPPPAAVLETAPEFAKLGDLAAVSHSPMDWATGPEGGTFPIDEAARLQVPPEAFPAPVSLRTVRIDLALSRVEPGIRKGWAYVIQSQGFDGALPKPVSLEIDKPSEFVRFARLDGSQWQAIPVPEGPVARIDIPHFSAQYISAIEWDSLESTPAPGDSAPLNALLSGSPAPAAPQVRNCKKTFHVQATGTDGKPRQEKLIVTKRFYDFDEKGVEKSKKDAEYKYAQAPSKYELIKPPTQKQDCAGTVLERLWGLGPYWITADNLCNNVLRPYGQKVSRFSVKPGDVAVWGAGCSHVAVVSSVAGYVLKDVTVETKDGSEPMYKNVLSFSGTDPLQNAYGAVEFYRVDPQKVKIWPDSQADCDEPPEDKDFYVFILKNASNGLYLGTKGSLKTRVRCSFEGGGIDCKPTDLVVAEPLLGPYKTQEDAQKELCAAITERKDFPLGIGLKGRWRGSETWYGLWDGSVRVECK